MRAIVHPSRRLYFLAALAAGFFFSSAPRSLAQEKPAPPEKPAGEESLENIRDTKKVLDESPDFPGKKRFQVMMDRTMGEADKAAPDKREDAIDGRIDELNAAAEEADWSAAPSTVRKTVTAKMADLNNRSGNFEAAQRFADRELEQDPNDRDALINRARAGYGLGDFQRSFKDADKAARMDSKDSDAYSTRALASYGLGHYLAAMEDARRALAINPNDRTAFSLLRLSEGRVRPVSMPSDRTEEQASVQREYQGMVQQMNQVEERRRLPAPDVAPSKIGERNIRNAANRIALKDYWSALTAADRAVAEAPQSAAAYYYRAAAHNLLGQYQEAARDASRSLALNPNDVASLDARTWAYHRLGRQREALADANRALEINPNDAYAYANRGFVHEKLGNFEAMIADFKLASTLNPQFETVYRDAAAHNTLEIALPADRRVPRGIARGTQAPAPQRNQKTAFMTVLVSSVIGGFLIALGLLHVMTGHWAKKMTAEMTKARSGIDTLRPSSAIDSGYEVGPLLGQGGMGVVYAGQDKALRRKVAIKMLRPELQSDARDRDRFLEEARTVAELRHPSIVEIYSIVEDPHGLCLIFEFINGRSIEALLNDRKRLTLGEVKAVLKPVCKALDYAHRHGVVHRDLKPSNIMVSVDGAVKVMDFGIARHAKDSAARLAVTGTIIGTPYYMAPEQEMGAVRKESDLFSLGACLYEMVTGERPFPSPADTPLKLAKGYAKPSRLAKGLPPELDALVDLALEPDPDKRIATARDFWALLDKVPS